MVATITTEYTNTRTRDAFIKAVAGESIARPIIVIDIRWNTYYPINGTFRPENLRAELQRNGIDYVYYHDLGNPFKGMTDVVEMERRYKERVKTVPTFYKVVDVIRERSGTACLMCYCAPPRPCHRFWLREVIEQSIRDASWRLRHPALKI